MCFWSSSHKPNCLGLSFDSFMPEKTVENQLNLGRTSVEVPLHSLKQRALIRELFSSLASKLSGPLLLWLLFIFERWKDADVMMLIKQNETMIFMSQPHAISHQARFVFASRGGAQRADSLFQHQMQCSSGLQAVFGFLWSDVKQSRAQLHGWVTTRDVSLIAAEMTQKKFVANIYNSPIETSAEKLVMDAVQEEIAPSLRLLWQLAL